MTIIRKPSPLTHSVKSICLLTIILLLGTSCKQSIQPGNTTQNAIPPGQELDSLRKEIINLVQKESISSFSVAVIKGEEVLWKEAFVSDPNDSTKVIIKGNELYPVASMTKSMTAVLTLKLVEKGMLSLSDEVKKYVGSDLVLLGRDKLKVKDLLNMTGGIPHGWIFIHKNGNYKNTPPEELYKLYNIANLPEGTFEYSNFSFGILQKVLEKASGQTFQYLMEKELFQPLGMNQSSIGHNQRPNDSDYLKNTAVYAFHPDGGAGVYASLSDLVEYAKLHLLKKPEVVSLESLEQMHFTKNSKDDIMALGIGNISMSNSKNWLVSNGGFSFPITCNSNLSILPEEELAIICLADKDVNSAADVMAIKIANHFSPGFQNEAFGIMTSYESKNNKPFLLDDTNAQQWSGKLWQKNQVESIFFTSSENGIEYSLNEKKEFKPIQNLRVDQQNIVRGNLTAEIFNPLTKKKEMKQGDLVLKLSENQSKLTGHVTFPFEEEEQYSIAIPIYITAEKKK